MYYKMINDRTVFSDCRTIQTNEGVWISNPSSEQIADAGWQVYVPPVVPSSPELEPSYEAVIEAIKKILSDETSELSDEDALNIAALYPTGSSKIGLNVSIGDRLWYDEKLYKVIQQHTVQEDGDPDTATSLFTEVSIIEGPEFVQPVGSEDAYMQGDKITFNGNHYISLIDNNTGSPEAYPAGGQQQ